MTDQERAVPVRQRERRRAIGLGAVLALQVVCGAFFIADVMADVRFNGWDGHTTFEAVVAVALFLGILMGGLEMRRTIERSRRAEAAVSAASGAFAALMDSYFERWGLTAAESEVALLAIKGFDGPEIAAIRGTAEGTIRAQLTRIYAKAGVTNRAQLVSLFIDDLMAGPLK